MAPGGNTGSAPRPWVRRGSSGVGVSTLSNWAGSATHRGCKPQASSRPRLWLRLRPRSYARARYFFLFFFLFLPGSPCFFFLVWPLSTGRSKGDGPGDMVGDGREADWAHGTGRAGQRGGWVGGNEASGRSEKVEYEGSELRVDDELGHHIQGHG